MPRWLGNLIDALALVLAIHLVLFGFTGLHFWAPITGPAEGNGDHGMRATVLIIFHFAVFMAAAARSRK